MTTEKTTSQAKSPTTKPKEFVDYVVVAAKLPVELAKAMSKEADRKGYAHADWFGRYIQMAWLERNGKKALS